MSNEQAYLQAIADGLSDIAHTLSDASKNEAADELLHRAVKLEAQLRKQFNVGVRFSVIQTQLQQLYAQQQFDNRENQVPQADTEIKKQANQNERVIFVHLYNVHGRSKSTWEKFLTLQALKEHSVNRPIYIDKVELEKLLRGKKGAYNHGYLEVFVNTADITADENNTNLHDAHGAPLLRLKQGALHIEAVVAFHCEGEVFNVNKQGKLLIQ